MQKKHKALTYLSVSVLSLAFLVSFSLKEDEYNILETSMFEVLSAINEKTPRELPDLKIEKVSLRKVGQNADLYNTFRATIVLKNVGGNIVDRTLSLSAGENQKHVFVKNNAGGFSLNKDQTYIIDNYDVLFDDRYNAGTLRFKLELMDTDDDNETDNEYTTVFFNDPSKIADLKVTDFVENKSVDFDFSGLGEEYAGYDLDLFVADNIESEFEETYSQAYSDGKIFEYFLIPNSLEILKSGYWRKTVFEKSLNFAGDKDYYFYLKATNPQNGYFVTSDVVHLVPQNELTKAAFAKYFLESADAKLENGGENGFDDIETGSWYAPYVQTLYNLGLLGTNNLKFYPENLMTRGEALKIIMNYFDADLTLAGEESHFKDISSGNELFHYAEGFYAAGFDLSFDGYLNPNLPATKSFVNQIINAYTKSN